MCPAERHDAVRRLVPVDAAEVRRIADEPPDVAPELSPVRPARAPAADRPRSRRSPGSGPTGLFVVPNTSL
jgi:hypothetical protein